MQQYEKYRFCPVCGGTLGKKVLKSGEPVRLVCSRCQFVFYLDPKVVACVIAKIEGKIIMLKRDIPPGIGLWAIPGGGVDVGEAVPDAARRETWEEVRLNVEIASLVGVYSYPGIAAVIIVYEAHVIDGILEAADEAQEVRLFSPHNIPWDTIAFSSTKDALKDYLRNRHPEVLPYH